MKFRVGLALHHDDWRHLADIPLRRELKAQRAANLQGRKSASSCRFTTHLRSFFDEMLNSVIRQTYTNWELVLLDAAMPTSGWKAACPRPCRGTIVYECIENGGIAANTTRGFALAHGDFIALLDHDDVLHPNAPLRLCRPSKAPEQILSTVTKSFSRLI